MSMVTNMANGPVVPDVSPILTQLIQRVLDDHTIGLLSEEALPRLSLRLGWRALVIGVGTQHVADWLALRAAPEGDVLRLESPAHWRSGPRRPDPRLRSHNHSHHHGNGNGNGNGYDLTLVRLALAASPRRDPLLATLVKGVRPGGILAITEWGRPDCDAVVTTPVRGGHDAFRTIVGRLDRVWPHGDPLWAAHLAPRLRSAGLTSVDGVIHSRLSTGGQAGCLLYSGWADQGRDALSLLGVPARCLAALHQAMVHPLTLGYTPPAHTTLAQLPK